MVPTAIPAITYEVYERLKSVLVRARAAAGASDKLTPAMSFVLGAFSNTLAMIVHHLYCPSIHWLVGVGDIPLYYGQAQPGAKVAHSGAVGLLIRVLKTEGIFCRYQGTSAQIIKAMLSRALLFVSKEQFERWALVLVISLSKLRATS